MSREKLVNEEDPGTLSAPRQKSRKLLDKSWYEISSFSFAIRILVWLSIIGVGGWLTSKQMFWNEVAGVFLLGIGFAHGVELQHQALHHTGFKSRKFNHVFGIFLGLPMLVSFYEYRIQHLAHHRLLGTTENREFFDYNPNRLGIAATLQKFFMVSHFTKILANFFQIIRGKPISGYEARIQTEVRRFYYVVSFFLIFLFVASYLFGSMRTPIIWGIALFFIACPLHVLIEAPEHEGCNLATTNVYENTRTILSNVFMTWLTNGNNFHVEHHLHPNVPIQKLHLLHQEHRHLIRNFSDSYMSFFRARRRSHIPLINGTAHKLAIFS